MTLDPRFLSAAIEAADCAGAVIRPYFRAKLATERKGDESPVTIADRNAEQAMRALLGKHFPSHGILGEEFGTAQCGGAVPMGARPDRRHPRLHHRPPGLRHAHLAALRGPPHPRPHRPTHHRRALDPGRRKTDRILRPVRRRAPHTPLPHPRASRTLLHLTRIARPVHADLAEPCRFSGTQSPGAAIATPTACWPSAISTSSPNAT